MPQELHVLRCFSCKMYQVQIVKKVPKWQCKICNEKQMTQVVYFRGSGAECRKFVQTQNIESANEKVLAVVDAWGLDCDSDESPVDLCDCSERKLAAEKLSSYLREDDSESKENLILSQNSPKRRKMNCGNKQTRSLPSKISHFSTERAWRPCSFPATDKISQLPNKYNKFLEPENVSSIAEEENASISQSQSSAAGNSLEALSNNLQGDLQGDLEPGDQNTEARKDLIPSQVDESSDSSGSPFQNVVSNLLDGLDDDFDFELDF